MNNLFEYSSFYWTRYERYDLRTTKGGQLYIVPGLGAKPEVYNPLEDKEQMALDALNVGMTCISRNPAGKIQKAVLKFITRYGLLGLMTSLPTTPNFMDYEAVYFPRNHFINAERLSTEEYISYFFPFEKLEIRKSGVEYKWDIEGEADMKALAMTFYEQPTAVNMSFQRQYAERFDWVVYQFKDLAYNLLGTFLYQEDYKILDEDERSLYRQSVSAFGSTAPYYHISFLDKSVRPVLVWDFYSLVSELQMLASAMLVDEEHPVKLCGNCMKVFVAENPDQRFCCPVCEDEFSRNGNGHGRKRK